MNTLAATVARMTSDDAKILTGYAAGETSRQIALSAGLSVDEVNLTIESLAKGDKDVAQKLAATWEAQALLEARDSFAAATPDLIADLLNRAVATEVPRLVRAADKISDLVDQLEAQLAEHEREHALRTEADKLEARLAEIRAELKAQRGPGAGGDAGPTAVHPRQIRAWAAENGFDCPAKGRLPEAVIAAYRKAAAA